MEQLIIGGLLLLIDRYWLAILNLLLEQFMIFVRLNDLLTVDHLARDILVFWGRFFLRFYQVALSSLSDEKLEHFRIVLFQRTKVTA